MPRSALPLAARAVGRSRALLLALGLALAGLPTSSRPAAACTRVLYTAPDGTVITGRSMDWSQDMRSNLWAFPRGIERNGAGGARTPRWRSRFGSVVVSGYDLGSAEGMNEQGLVANLLYLAESDYGKPDGKPVLSISLWAQHVLGPEGDGKPVLSLSLWAQYVLSGWSLPFSPTARGPSCTWRSPTPRAIRPSSSTSAVAS